MLIIASLDLLALSLTLILQSAVFVLTPFPSVPQCHAARFHSGRYFTFSENLHKFIFPLPFYLIPHYKLSHLFKGPTFALAGHFL